MLPMIIGAAATGLLPLITEAFRDKPDPQAAATLIKSKRDEMVDKAIGGGLQRAAAEKQVDTEIAAAIKEAERQGQFNFPGGEMLASAVIGAISGPLIGKGISKLGGMMGKGKAAAAAAATTADDAAAAAAKVAPKGNASAVGDVDDVGADVYRAGFSSPRADAMRRGAGDTVPPVGPTRNIGYEQPPVDTSKFTMRDADMAPFPSRGRGDFNVEVIGSTGGARMPTVEVQGPFPRMAQGGERLGMAERPLGINFRPVSDAPRVRPDPAMEELVKEQQMAEMFARRNRIPNPDARFMSGDRIMGEQLFIQ